MGALQNGVVPVNVILPGSRRGAPVPFMGMPLPRTTDLNYEKCTAIS